MPYCEAHPRSRGENLLRDGLMPDARGSSPLTRGKPRAVITSAAGVRLIPAHAGKTPSVDVAVSFSGAHPRSRGENGTRSDLAYVTEGSSPLTRGKPSRQLADLARQRLIPAHAGKTRKARTRCRPRTAHPRSRGENMARPDRTG